MTNLSGSGNSWQKHITRERVLVGIPLLLGVLIGAVVFGLFGLPHWLAFRERTQRIAELRALQQDFPLLQRRVRLAQQNLTSAQQRQDLVIDLLAGRGEIETFLTQLSRTAARSGVVIERYEPVPASPVRTESPKPPTKSDDEDEAEQAKAAEALKGYDKTAVLLQVEGPYQGILQFLRAMEQLELLVQPSDLELKSVPLEEDDEGVVQGPALTELKLRLSFFDKRADGDQGDGQSSKEASAANPKAPF